MIDELIVKIVDSMINTDIISKDDKEAYVYAYTITLEKVLTLITISIMGVVLNRLVNIIIFLCTFMFLRRRTGGFILKHLVSVLWELILYVLSLRHVTSYG